MTRKEEIRQEAISYLENIQGKEFNSVSESQCFQVYAFEEGAKWADSTMVEKVVEWLSLNAELYGGFNGGKLNEMVCNLKKAMGK